MGIVSFVNTMRQSNALDSRKMICRVWAKVIATILLGGGLSVSAAPNLSRHVVLVVWDGMRPDFVSERNTPVLWKLARAGTTFRNHHAVYPSATEVNGVALATGAYPNRNGIIANYEFRPEIDKTRMIHSEDRMAVRKGDELSGGKYVALPTLAENVRAAGLTSFVSAAKPVGLLQDRHELISLGDGAWVLGPLGGFANSDKAPAAERDRQATVALTDSLSRKKQANFSLLWLSEPDDTEHKFAPGSKEALAAMTSSDENLGRILAALDRNHARESTDVLIVSDHGFSTIQRSVDLRKILKDAGFDVVTQFTSEPKPGQIMLVGQGGSALFYVIEHDAAVIRHVVEFLQQSDFAGPIFTRGPVEGTFGFDQARIDSPHAPDVEMAFRWNNSKNQFGIPGMIDADWNRKAGQGTHATLSQFDMHNLLIAVGPAFRSGLTDDLPSGNVDLAPTIYRILGITSPQPLDGRVLSEAMANLNDVVPQSETKTVEATREFPAGKWRQTLKVSRAGSTIYLDQANGAFEPKR
jgi:predicted AlkP superfamily pyrophosphatase or phosphodiesterase